MSQDAKPTLESIPQIGYFGIRDHELGSMIQVMQKTGFQTWGFVIYRGTYSDDAAWQRYLDLMKEKIRAYLEEHDLAELLLQYLDFTIIEDPAFDGASKDTVRNAFREWASHRCVERDGAGADDPYLTIHHLAPRFSH